jgi:sec-independent protein translocase protein TatA
MGIHWTDLIIISGVALLIFGPKRLPEMGSALGKTYKEFKKSMREAAEFEANDVSTPARIVPNGGAIATVAAKQEGI